MIQVVYEDIADDPKVSATAAEKLITVDRVHVLLTDGPSSCIMTATEVAEKYGVPAVTIGGAAKEITTRGLRYVFRTPPNSTSYAIMGVNFLEKVIAPKYGPILRIAYLHDTSTLGVDHKNCFIEELNRRHPEWTVVAVESYDLKTVDFKPILEKIKSANPDVLCLVPYLTNAVTIYKQMAEMKYRPKVVFDVGGAASTALDQIELAGEACKYNFCMHEYWCDWQYPDASAIREKSLESMRRYNNPFDMAVRNGYMDVYIVKEAITACKSLDPSKIRDALATTRMFFPWYGEVFFYPNGQAMAYVTVSQIQEARPDEPWQKNGLTYHEVYPPPYNSSMPIFP
jgi:branched-chain amino acid transport system substrate-binding protein